MQPTNIIYEIASKPISELAELPVAELAEMQKEVETLIALADIQLLILQSCRENCFCLIKFAGVGHGISPKKV